MMGFKSFHCARVILAGIETMHMIKKGQLDRPKAKASTAASQFYSLAFYSSADHPTFEPHAAIATEPSSVGQIAVGANSRRT